MLPASQHAESRKTTSLCGLVGQLYVEVKRLQTK